MEEIHKNIFQLWVPFVGHPQSGIHAYLIRGERGQRSLLVDTGLNTDGCEEALRGQIAALGLSMAEVDLLVTHMHVDHSGAMLRVKDPGSALYAGAKDREYLIEYRKPPEQWRWLLSNNSWAGTPPEFATRLEDHIAVQFRPVGEAPIRGLPHGAALDYGGYAWEVVDFSGHCAGQIGLWNRESATVIVGDHVASNLFPNVTTWNLEEDFVGNYFRNLRALAGMETRLLLPAHGDVLEGDAISARVEEMLQHYQQRCQRILGAVEEAAQPLTAFQVNGSLKRHGAFTDVPPGPRWFMCSDTLAYLQHLAFTGHLSSERRGETMYYAAP